METTKAMSIKEKPGQLYQPTVNLVRRLLSFVDFDDVRDMILPAYYENTDFNTMGVVPYTENMSSFSTFTSHCRTSDYIPTMMVDWSFIDPKWYSEYHGNYLGLQCIKCHMINALMGRLE